MIVGFSPERIRDLERSGFHSLKSIEDDGDVFVHEMIVLVIWEELVGFRQIDQIGFHFGRRKWTKFVYEV